MRALAPAALLLTSALALTACGGSDNAADSGNATSGSSATASAEATAPLGPDRWMEDVYGEATDTTLGEMIIPGTHDSGSARIDDSEPCDITAAASTPQGLVDLGAQNPCTTAALYRAQGTSLGEQLSAGIRYLDLRVSVPAGQVVTDPAAPAPGPDDEVPLILEHEYVSEPLKDGLLEILEFASANPKEQVILDFQKVDLPEGANAAYYYAALAEMLKTVSAGNSPSVCNLAWDTAELGVTAETLATEVTLQDAWDAGRNLVVLVPQDTLAADTCYTPRANAIISLWPNTEDPAQSQADNLTYLQDRQTRLAATPPNCSNGGANIGQGDNWCGFFVNQMQLTFQPTTFVTCLNQPTPECSLEAYAAKVNNQTPGLVSQWVEQGLPVNIVIVDFFENSDPSYTETLIELNRTRLAAG